MWSFHCFVFKVVGLSCLQIGVVGSLTLTISFFFIFCCWIVGSPKMVVAGSLTLFLSFSFLLLDCRVPQNGSGWFFNPISFFLIFVVGLSGPPKW